jgi:peptidylprolyl isomerase
VAFTNKLFIFPQMQKDVEYQPLNAPVGQQPAKKVSAIYKALFILILLVGAGILTIGVCSDASNAKNLQIDIITKIADKDCVAAKIGDALKVAYVGTLVKDGSQFDTSIGRAPFEFTLGQGQVIKGWDQGILGMCVGERRKLMIPSDLAYGSGGNILPGEDLVFVVDLLSVGSKSSFLDTGGAKKLQIGILTAVDDIQCRSAKNGDMLMMNYVGTLVRDGSQFDSSNGFEFVLGSGQVIKGWDQGILGMCVGEQRKLIIPSDLAYGSSGSRLSGEDLIFVVDLVDIGETFM